MDNTYYLNKNDNTIICTARDEFPSSPREWSNIGTFLTWDGYNSPDENKYSNFEDFMIDFGVDFGIYEYNLENMIEELIKVAEQNGIILYPVYVQEYYNVEYSLRENGTLAGVIYADRDFILEETYITENDNIREEVKKYFNSEIELYNQYMNAETMQFAVYDLLGNCIDSCCGFYGMDINENGIKDYCEIDNSEELGEFNSIDECLGSMISKGMLEVKLV